MEKTIIYQEKDVTVEVERVFVGTKTVQELVLETVKEQAERAPG